MVVLVICSMSLLIVGLDSTIVNVALPSIHRSLHASVSGYSGRSTYTLTIASLLMLSGSTADRNRPQARVPGRRDHVQTSSHSTTGDLSLTRAG
jgi:MFS family permease